MVSWEGRKGFSDKNRGDQRVLKGAQVVYFELLWPRTKLPLNSRKPQNNSLLRKENTKEIIINHKETKVEKDEEDLRRIQTKNLKKIDQTFHNARKP